MEDNIDQIINYAIRWALATVHYYQDRGRPLNAVETEIAIAAGVIHPELIRIIETDHVPEPKLDELAALRIQSGLLHSHSVGLTLGNQVFIRNGFMRPYLLAHEFRHVYQFEQLGSLEIMIRNYLLEVVQFGYRNAPLEIDAINTRAIYFE
jgi:hypothetical protein